MSRYEVRRLPAQGNDIALTRGGGAAIPDDVCAELRKRFGAVFTRVPGQMLIDSQRAGHAMDWLRRQGHTVDEVAADGTGRVDQNAGEASSRGLVCAEPECRQPYRRKSLDAITPGEVCRACRAPLVLAWDPPPERCPRPGAPSAEPSAGPAQRVMSEQTQANLAALREKLGEPHHWDGQRWVR